MSTSIREALISRRSLFVPLSLFALSLIVYSLPGLGGGLFQETGIFLYAGQRMAEGVPPYVSIFARRTPVGHMLAGIGVIFSRWLGTEDIYTVRLLFLVFACLTVVAVYFLGKYIFSSSRAGLWSALTFLLLRPLARDVVAGPEPKIPLLLFVTLGLLFMHQKRWFWAGLFGGLCFLIWQPMAIFPFITVILALNSPSAEKQRAILHTLAGIILPIVIVVAYFAYQQALSPFLEGAFLFNIVYGERPVRSLLGHLRWPIMVIIRSFGLVSVVILIGLLTILSFYILARRRQSSLLGALTKDKMAPLLLSFPLAVLWSFYDFQSDVDSYILLPYAALGFAYLLDWLVQRMRERPRDMASALVSAVLLVSVGAQALNRDYTGYYRVMNNRVLQRQEEAADQIVECFGEEVKVATVGVPEAMVLLHKVNPNRYLYVRPAQARLIQAAYPGGIKGWVADLETYQPEVVVMSTISGEDTQQFLDWLWSNYHQETTRPWKIYIRNSSDMPDCHFGRTV